MRSTSYLRAALALAAALLLGGTLLAVPAASAPAQPISASTADRSALSLARATCNVPHCWTAISFNTRTGYSGWRNNARTKAVAMRDALASCKARRENRNFRRACESAKPRKVFKENGCLAVLFRRRANGNIAEWAKGKHFYKKRAINRARKQLNGPGVIVLSRWVCTNRKR